MFNNTITKTMTGSILLLAILLVASGSANAQVAVNPTGSASGSLVAVSGTGNAHCNTNTCVAVSGTGNARAGCKYSGSCGSSIIRCNTFVCATLAVSALGTANAWTYCDTFGQACVSLSVAPNPRLYYCYGDINNAGYCRGVF